MPPCAMQRVIFHWTAGTHKASSYERGHYHLLIEGDGKLVRGTHPITDNISILDGVYAAHTLACNSGSIGVSLCCMIGAHERPFESGPYPLTKAQWDALALVIADLCNAYKINVGPKTVLSHAEVQVNLGIRQKAKWDIAILPFAPTFDTARECGDEMRRLVQATLA
jgi:N-acetyl-anhydromuramyl-L-alanine amidase AmpD